MTESWDVSPRASLSDVLAWCRERGADRLLVATRLERASKKPVLLVPAVVESVRRIFGGAVLRETLARRWPGTELIGHSGMVYLIDFTPDVEKRMVAEENDWSAWIDWHDPPLPEDICLFRQGDTRPLLVSVTHDGEAWIFDAGPLPRSLAVKSEIPLPDDLLPPPPFYA
jgi:hypothetical protein